MNALAATFLRFRWGGSLQLAFSAAGVFLVSADFASQQTQAIARLMNSVALISALLGALVSASLALGVRWLMDTRAQKLAERQLAYVHFVSVSECLAAEVLFRKYVEALGLQEITAQLRDPGGSFESSHRACVLLADYLLKTAPTQQAADPSGSLLPAKIRLMLDSLKSSRLDADRLAKLPRKSIESFTQLQTRLVLLSLYIEQWVSYIEIDKKDWITAEVIHEQWLLLCRLLETLRSVRSTLIAEMVMTEAEANALLARQVAVLAVEGFSPTLNKPRIAAALSNLTPDT